MASLRTVFWRGVFGRGSRGDLIGTPVGGPRQVVAAAVAPATVEQSGVRVLSAFPLTKGQVPKLLAIALALVAPLLLAGLLGLARGAGAAAVGAIVTYLLLAPAWAGALVHLYRRSAVSQDV